VKPRLIFLIGLALMCLALAAFALRSAAAVSGSSGASRGGRYVLSGIDHQVEDTTFSGGGYRLAETTQSEVKAIASGGKYRLAAPEGSENGCCCMFLPCVSK